MKRGSKARKCAVCGDVVFWTIPTGSILGIPTAKIKTVKPYGYSKDLHRYVCNECLDKSEVKQNEESKDQMGRNK